jgi:DNA-binding CsgD family transcriptional regulator
VLGDGASVTAAARVLDVRPAVALDALDILAGADIVRRSGQIEFTAPLLRDAALELLGHGERSRLHRRAAHALEAAGAPAAAVAAQLMQCDGAGESWAADALRRAAGQAGERRTTIAYLHRALAEEPPAPARAQLLVELATAELAGRGPDAARHLADAVRLLPPGIDRSGACEQLALVLWGLGRYAEAGRAFAEGLEGLEGRGGSLAARLGAGCVAAARVGSQPGPDGRIPLDGAALRDAPAQPAVAAELALELLLAGGRHDRVVELAMAALAGDPPRRRSCGSPALQAAVCALVWADALDAAEQAATEAIEAGAACDPDPAVGVMLLLRACARHRRGRLAEAHADALAAKARVLALLPVPVQPPAALLAEIRLELGRVAEAAAGAQRARDAAASEANAGTGGRAGYAFALAAQGRVELALGRPRAALSSLLDCGRRMEEAEVRSPALAPWRSLAAVAALRIGDRERAAALAAEELTLADALGSPRARGLALRAGATARQRGQRLDELQAAAAALERSPGVLDRAHALAELGGELRRSGQRRASRDALRRALDLASRCGAEALVRRVRQELLAAGARPRRTRISGVASLTPREREIAELAALGRSNRAIAADLIVSEKTIEWHLANAYRKLEIRGRGGLAQTLEQK